MAGHYGFAQATNDSRSEDAVQVEGDWIVWQDSVTDATGTYGLLYGYNRTSRELVGIGVEPGQRYFLPRLAGGRVLYYREGPDGSNGMFLWDLATRQARPLPIALGGHTEPDSFGGEWAVVFNQGGGDGAGNATADGWWAWNVQDGRLVHLYTPLPGHRRPDGSYETLTFTAVDGAVAYYPLTVSDATSSRFNATLYAVDLATQRRQEYPLEGRSLYRLSVHDGYAVSDPGLHVVALGLANGTWWQVDRPDESSCAFPTSGHGWMAYSCSEDGQGHDAWQATLLDLATGSRTRLSAPNFLPLQSATDGSTWVLEAMRGRQRMDMPPDVYRVYDTFYADVYWAPVPR